MLPAEQKCVNNGVKQSPDLLFSFFVTISIKVCYCLKSMFKMSRETDMIMKKPMKF